MAEVVLRDLTKKYGDVLAVDDISLEVADGEFLSLLGPSGCGKTSTMRMIAGLEDITSGSIEIGGQLVNRLSSANRNVAMAFENYGLYPHMSVFGNVAYPLRVRGKPRRTVEEAVLRVARMLHIDGVLDRKPAELSGGFQQRVSLARALVRDPSVFLMDEPISHLDADLRSVMRAELKRLQQENGATTIYVTHDQLEAMAMADRIAVMNLGSIQQVGTPLEIFNQPANEFVASFIGEPPMNLFDAALVQDDRGDVSIGADEHVVSTISGDRTALLRGLGAGRKVRVGVRPKDFTVGQAGSPAGLAATVRVVEQLIDRVLATVDTPVGRLRIELPADHPIKDGESITLTPLPDRIHLFDPESGRAVVNA